MNIWLIYHANLRDLGYFGISWDFKEVNGKWLEDYGFQVIFNKEIEAKIRVLLPDI